MNSNLKKLKIRNVLILYFMTFFFLGCTSGGRDNCIEGMMADGMTYEKAVDECDDFNTNSNNRE